MCVLEGELEEYYVRGDPVKNIIWIKKTKLIKSYALIVIIILFIILLTFKLLKINQSSIILVPATVLLTSTTGI